MNSILRNILLSCKQWGSTSRRCTQLEARGPHRSTRKWSYARPIPKLIASLTKSRTLLMSTGAGVVLMSAWGLSECLIPPVHAGNNFIADIVKNAGPAVVFVEIKGRHPQSGKRVTLANGSGFIVRSNGLVLTNAHVVENKTQVSVKLNDGAIFDGVVTVVDPVSDLAVIKIKTNRHLPVIPLGKSSTIRPGEFVAAMGSPLSLHRTNTVGIVSSPLRDSEELGLRNKMDYIQTDAVIGLGNSGGPLVNLDGEAIGINTLKLTEGISFAIPSDYAFDLIEKAEQLIIREGPWPSRESKKIRYMGITMASMTPAITNELRGKGSLPSDFKHGVYVYRVCVSSPAYIDGLHAGDVIVDINGQKMFTSADVYSMVESSPVLRVGIFRGKNYEVKTVTTEAIEV